MIDDDMFNKGTPITLEAALWEAICVGPMYEIKERSFTVMQDFLAQKFQKAFLENAENEQTLKALQKLWQEVVQK